MIRRGDKGKGRRGEEDFAPSPCLRVSASPSGFSLVELVITVAVMAILTLGVIPLVQVSVKRQKEQQLHEALRQVREAIDQFHREALAGAQMQVNQQTGQNNQQNQTVSILADPRVRLIRVLRARAGGGDDGQAPRHNRSELSLAYAAVP